MRYGKNGWATFSWVTKAPSLNEARFGQRLQIRKVWSSKLWNFPLLYFSSELKLKTHLYYKKEASFRISLISANYEREVFYWCFKRDTSIKLSKSSASGSTLQVLYFLWPSSLFHMKKKHWFKKIGRIVVFFLTETLKHRLSLVHPYETLLQKTCKFMIILECYTCRLAKNTIFLKGEYSRLLAFLTLRK